MVSNKNNYPNGIGRLILNDYEIIDAQFRDG
jgi:hypothetical protein